LRTVQRPRLCHVGPISLRRQSNKRRGARPHRGIPSRVVRSSTRTAGPRERDPSNRKNLTSHRNKERRTTTRIEFHRAQIPSFELAPGRRAFLPSSVERHTERSPPVRPTACAESFPIEALPSCLTRTLPGAYKAFIECDQEAAMTLGYRQPRPPIQIA
jgi:hypothetical protein